MAKGSAPRGRGKQPRKAGAAPKRPAPQKRRAPTAPAPEPAPLPPGPFRLGAIAGATPGKWIDTWQERMPRTALELVALEVADQRSALDDGTVDAALVRLPIDRTDLHVIALYDEVPVVVTSADSHLTAADELDLADLAGEIVIVPADDVLALEIAGAEAPRFPAPETTADAIATVAAGVGLVVVPMSLARLHQRKDAEYRPLRDAPASTVALAWRSADDSPLIAAFVGIVRGRTANSSR